MSFEQNTATSGHATPAFTTGRADLALIADLVAPGVRLLDVGCGTGDLLARLTHEKNVDGRGLELSQAGVNACVTRGLSVIQGDADTDLSMYPDKAFHYVVLSQTIQATHRPRQVLDELLRIGEKVIVSFPNFGHWKVRLHLTFLGRMPVTKTLDNPWYETPNIHFCTILDFINMCKDMDVSIEDMYARRTGQSAFTLNPRLVSANLWAEESIMLLSRGR